MDRRPLAFYPPGSDQETQMEQPPMPSISIPLAGQFHRPKPNIHILSIIPLGHELKLLPEPTNQFDPNAIAVLIDLQSLPVDRLALLSTLVGEDFDVSELCAQGDWHLGYIAATGGKPARGGPGNLEVIDLASVFGWYHLKAVLSSSVEGKPAVTVYTEEQPC